MSSDPLAAMADAATRMSAAWPQLADTLEGLGELVLTEGSRISRTRFVRCPEACSDDEYYAPFPLLAGDVDL